MSGPSVGVTLLFVSSDENTWKQEAELAHALDIEHVELRLEYPAGNAQLTERRLRMIKNLLQGVPITIHAPTSWLSLITPHKALRQLAQSELIKTLEIACQLSCQLITIHGGALPHADLRGDIDIRSIFRESVQQLIDFAQKVGQILAIENVPKGSGSRRYYPATVDEVLKATANTNLKITFDVGHAIENKEDPVEAVQKLRGKLTNVHLHDFTPEGGSHKELGTGILPLEKLLSQLKTQNYAGFLTLELYETDDKKAKLERSLRRLRELLKGA